MLIRLLAIGNKMPEWVSKGFNEYAKRLQSVFKLELIEFPAEKRTKHVNIPQLMIKEGEKLLATVKPKNYLIVLDEKGELWTTKKVSHHLSRIQLEARDIDILIGGADGLSKACLDKAHVHWSLSPLTFPHPLVRILVAEQLYRAVSLLQNHPYHRE